MLRVRHILNNEKVMKLQFRTYFAEASKIEAPDNVEINEKFENVGKWVCTFSCSSITKNEIKKKVAIISSKKKIIKAFKEFILSNFAAINKSKKQKNNDVQIFENANLVIDDIIIDIRKLRKSVEKRDIVKTNTLIEDAIVALNTLQTKLSELGELDANKKDE